MRPAVDFIAELRQAADLAALPVGRRVVVIGGGMTAIDAAVQSKKLGAEEVTIVYRRGRERMEASGYEQELAATSGRADRLRRDAASRSSATAPCGAVEFAYTGRGRRGCTRPASGFELDADQVLLAIGQRLDGARTGLELAGGKIAVTGPGRTSLRGRLGRRRLRERRRRPDGHRGRRGARRGDGHPRRAEAAGAARP